MILKQMRGKKPSGKDVDGKDFNCIPKSHQISPSEVVEPLAPRITPQMDEGLFLILQRIKHELQNQQILKLGMWMPGTRWSGFLIVWHSRAVQRMPGAQRPPKGVYCCVRWSMKTPPIHVFISSYPKLCSSLITSLVKLSLITCRRAPISLVSSNVPCGVYFYVFVRQGLQLPFTAGSQCLEDSGYVREMY